MSLTHEGATRNALADLIDDRVNLTAAGTVQISTTEDDYIGAELLAQIVLNAAAFGAAAAGIIAANGLPLSDPSADGTGTAAFFRVINGASLEIFKGVVTVTSGGGDMELTAVAITTGEQVNITTFTYEAST